MYLHDYDYEDDFLTLPQIGLNPTAREWYPEAPFGRSRRFPRYHDYDVYHHQGYLGHNAMSYNRNKHNVKDMNNYMGYGHGHNSFPNEFSNESKGFGKQRKFSYRSKQNKIDAVLYSLKRRYASMGKLADGEVLRGMDTLRIDVKRFTALQQIEKVNDDILANEAIEIIKADFPVSQKNKFQKKGFIAYLKCGSPEQAKMLFDKLNVMMDPKWKDKKLFRVNIAVDQQHESLDVVEASEKSSEDGTASTEGSSTSETESESNADPSLKKYEERIQRGVWEHATELTGDEKILQRKMSTLTLKEETERISISRSSF